VRNYTVEPHKRLGDTWSIASTYDVSVYGPNGFVRYFRGSIGAKAAMLDIRSSYRTEEGGALAWRIRNFGEHKASVVVLDAYTGNHVIELLRPDEELKDDWSGAKLFGWYDVVVTVVEDPTFSYRLAGHIETGRDSFTDPALGGLITLKA
jgi:phospholipase C